MSSFQRKLDLLEHIPRAPRKVSTRQLLNFLEADGHENLIIRKIQRDLESLEQLGLFGIESDKRSKPYGWSINLNWKKLNLSLMDANSALAFATLQEVAHELLPETTLDELAPYFEKAQTIINNEASPLISHWKRSVGLINHDKLISLPEVDKNALSTIKKAIYHKKQIHADLKRYLISNQAAIWKHYHHINPLGLILREKEMTLVCSFGSFHKKVYKFPIAFIKNVALTNEPCILLDSYDFDKIKNSYISTNNTHNTISLSILIRKDSTFILSNASLSPDQTIELTKEPGIVKLKATVASTPKLKTFLRGMANNIEVLEPVELREYFKKLSRNMLKKYNQ